MCTQPTTTESLALSVTQPECPGTFGGKRRLRLCAGFSAFSLDYGLCCPVGGGLRWDRGAFFHLSPYSQCRASGAQLGLDVIAEIRF